MIGWSHPAALGATLAIEVPCYAACLGPLAHMLGSASLRWPRSLMTAIAVNLVTHPLAFAIAWPLLRRGMGPTAALLAVEAGVLIAEVSMVWRVTRDPLLAAVAAGLANVASLTVGLIAGQSA